MKGWRFAFYSSTKVSFHSSQTLLRCHCWPKHCRAAADWGCMQAEEDEQRLSEAQQAAEDEAALRAMREEGMLSDQPTSSQPQPGKLGHVNPPPPFP